MVASIVVMVTIVVMMPGVMTEIITKDLLMTMMKAVVMTVVLVVEAKAVLAVVAVEVRAGSGIEGRPGHPQQGATTPTMPASWHPPAERRGIET